jgi:hypothetical protein
MRAIRQRTQAPGGIQAINEDWQMLLIVTFVNLIMAVYLG